LSIIAKMAEQNMISLRENPFDSDKKYLEACNEMCGCNDSLIKTLETNDKIKLDENEVLLICGPSAAGKSTFLARFKSDKNNTEFMEDIIKISESHETKVTLEGVEIGARSGSTTIVPNFYTKNKFTLLDLAGFMDTNPSKSHVLSLLNHILFTRLFKFKLLVVFNLAQFSDFATFNTAINSYLKEFKSLFTESHFVRCLSSTVFLLTKADKFTENVIKNAELSYIIGDGTDENKLRRCVQMLLMDYNLRLTNVLTSEIPGVIKRMNEHFVILNYKLDDGETVQKKILTAVSAVPYFSCEELKFDSVSSTNLLCEKGWSIIKSYLMEVINLSTQLSGKIKSFRDEMEKLFGVLANKQTFIFNLEHENKLLIEEKGNNSKVIDELTKELIKKPEERKQLEIDFKTALDYFERIKVRTNNMRLLCIEPLRSIVWKKSMFKTIHRIQLDACRLFGVDSKPDHLLITSKEYSDVLLKLKVCKTKQDVENLKLHNIYHDNIKIETKNDSIHAFVEHEEEVVLLILSEIDISKTISSEHLLEQFIENIDKLRLQIETINSFMTNAETRIQKLLEKNKEIDVKYRSNENTIKTISQDLATHKSNSKKYISETKEFTSQYLKNLTSIRTKDIFLMTVRLSQILIRTSIDKTRFSDIKTLEQSIADEGRKVELFGLEVDSWTKKYD
jgi:GTPase SAR1 family protein